MIKKVHHIQVRVPAALMEPTIRFYEEILELDQIPVPIPLQKTIGAWFLVNDGVEIHIGMEEIANKNSGRHICFEVDDLERAQKRIEGFGVPIEADTKPIENWIRFYMRDPGGNRIEINQLRKMGQ